MKEQKKKGKDEAKKNKKTRRDKAFYP